MAGVCFESASVAQAESKIKKGLSSLDCHGAHARDRVAILLCTYEGGRFLRAQLASLLGQSHANWCIYASDDCSTDSTRKVLAEFQDRVGCERLNMRAGPQRGFVTNFLGLACARDIDADYFAFCDQDDVWEPEKLSRALTWLSQINPLVPALYCSRTCLIDQAGGRIGLSPLYSKAPHFGNAIVQSIAGGNTMVFNAAARRLLTKAGSQVVVPSHDWWLYILVTAMSGVVRYDRWPSVRYRVHGANAVGTNRLLRARLVRLGLLLKGRLKTWTDMHLAALLPLAADISPECRRLLAELAEVRRCGFLGRIWRASIRGVYRQNHLESIAFYIALVLRKA